MSNIQKISSLGGINILSPNSKRGNNNLLLKENNNNNINKTILKKQTKENIS